MARLDDPDGQPDRVAVCCLAAGALGVRIGLRLRLRLGLALSVSRFALRPTTLVDATSVARVAMTGVGLPPPEPGPRPG